MLEIQKSTLDLAGASRLEQIRASMAGEKLAGKPATSTDGPAAPAADPAGVARLDEIRASLAKEKPTGGSTAAG